MDFIDQLIPDIRKNLMTEFKMKQNGKYLRDGVCPSCGQKTLWTWYDKPLSTQCERVNNCGLTYTAKELFPELFVKIAETYPPTPEEPNKTANAYLSLIRGFDVSKIKGWYDQASFYSSTDKVGTECVRFYLNHQKDIWFDRFVEDLNITNKHGKKEKRNKNFKGAYQGLWWQPPTLEIKDGSEVIFTEGILDAIALNINGYPAVSIMSAGTFPSESIKPYLGKNITWVIGLDNDKAGLISIEKHAKTLRDMGEKVRAIVSSQDFEKSDWNDLHQKEKLTANDMQRYRLYGDVVLANSKESKAFATFMLHDEKIKHFVIDYKRLTYAVKVDLEKYAEEDTAKIGSDEDLLKSKKVAFKTTAKLNRIAEFTLDYLYHQKPENGNDGLYVFRVDFANFAPSQELLLPHTAFASATKFKECALSVSGAMFEGDLKDITYLYKRWTNRWKKVVKTLDYIGYDKDSKAYIFNDIAVRNGNIIKQNPEGYFSLDKSGIKTLVRNGTDISTESPKDFYLDYELAYGMVGLVALTWTLGTLFAEQIAEKHSSYPFFELSGREGGTGKSHLVEFLYKLQGREYTPFNPFNSTASARMREPSVVSNGIFCCNEGQNEDDSNRPHSAKFHWSMWKDFFERKGTRTINTKNQQTYNPPFRGALMIVQNVTVMADTPFLQRIIHQTMTSAHHSVDGRNADMRLMNYTKSDLSGWLINVLKKEATILKRFFDRYNYHNQRLQKYPSLKTQRIIHNHSQMLALADCLHLAVPIGEDTQSALVQHITAMAVERETVLKKDHPVIEQFWRLVEDINGIYKNSKTGKYEIGAGPLNHSEDSRTVAINLTHFYQEVKKQGVPFNVDPKELKRYLENSTHPQWIKANEAMYSVLDKKTIRCWVFKYKDK